jgi:modulator of FtsH protease HflC
MSRSLARGASAFLPLLALGASSCACYTLDETEQAVLTRFGEPIGQPALEPGLHFKVPFSDTVNRFEKRWLEWNGDPNQIPTKDKKYIWVDTFGRWRIADPLRFFQRMRDERTAQSRLNDIIDGETRNAIASYNLIEVVRTSNRAFEDEEYAESSGAREEVSGVVLGRERLIKQILSRAKEIVAEFGVELVDVQIRRINYVDEVQVKVFERMISERKRIAEKSRSEGFGKSAEIRGQKERELKSIQSEAYRRAQEIQGKGDAEAAKIYALAFGKDPEFYQFLRTLDAYPMTLDSSTSVLLGTDSDFYRYLKSAAKK